MDDELQAVEPMAQSFKEQGLSVSTVTNVQEALRKIESGEQFEAILLDVMMGPVDLESLGIGDTQGGRLAGLRLAEHIRETEPDLPIIAYTAYPAMEEVQRSSAFTHVISKATVGPNSEVWTNLHERFLAKKLDQTEEWVRQSLDERDLILFEAKPELFKRSFEEFQERRSKIIVSLNENLLHVLNGKIEHMPNLSYREFEEVCAHSLTRLGYDVTITPTGPDDGIDLIAVPNDPIVRAAYIVQCKRNRLDLKVETPVLKQLRCVVDDYRASGGIVMTSSYFTSGAEKYAQENQYRLQLFDVLRLKSILESGS